MELAPEIFQLAVVHEWFVLGGTVVFRQENLGFHASILHPTVGFVSYFRRHTVPSTGAV